ncbi:hypothetical protein ACFWN7_04360 [Agromyces sp. NPDC058484]|uniref:hypothetical protein n=1 Tax=Agromyces sp. NPDC058484 TaxID=3346524 RepID=UPI00364EC82C
MPSDAMQADRVLELRIHGVNNTAPHDLLDVPADEVRRVAGDALGGFWRPTADSVEARRAAPGANRARGYVPRGITREAYSWGGMVRTTPGVAASGKPGGAASAILGVLARIGWTFLLPFSVANAAAWAWRLPTGTDRVRLRARAGAIRVFGVLLTLALVATLANLSIDVVALQCFGTDTLLCTVLPRPFASLESWTPGRRMALLSFVPIVALVGVWLLSSISRLRYDVAERFVAARDGDTAAPASPALLSRRGFWHSAGATHRLALAHLAAGVGLVAAMLSFQAAVGGDGAAWPVALASCAVVGAAIVTAFATRTMPFERMPLDREAASRFAWWPAVLVASSAAIYVIALIVVGFGSRDAWQGQRWVATGVSVSGIVLVLIVAGATVIVFASAFFRLPARGARFEAWHGLGQTVFLTAALAISLLLSGLLSVAVGNWLNGGAGASALLPRGDGSVVPPDVVDDAGASYPVLSVPALHPWFGGAALVALIVGLLVIGGALLRPRNVDARARAWTASDRPETPPAETVGGPMAVGTSAELDTLLGPVRERKRAVAARLHLAEPIVGVLVIVAAVAIVGGVVLTIAYPRLLDPVAPVDTQTLADRIVTAAFPWLDVAMGVWGVITVLVIAALVSGVGPAQRSRPLAVVWDLACFLPRAGHPLGAPCYTERAVPEVSRRVLWWLQQPPDRTTGAPTRVVLVAHSMGGVVALSALFSLAAHPGWEALRDRVALLTFGVQVRPYFGRFFPELLGPHVLGVTACERPRLWAADPWRADAAAGRERTSAAPARSGVPAREWISLWRLTDFLGFAAFANVPGNPVDRAADEIDTSGYTGEVGTHGEYYRVHQYHRELLRLAGLAPPG